MIELGVNSYTTVALANAYHETQLHNADWFRDYVQEDIAAALITVTRYIDYYEYKGRPLSGTQALKWPRVGAYYNGGYIDSSSVPVQVVYATAQIALDYLRKGIGPGDAVAASSTIEGAISSLKAGPVQIDYTGSGGTVSQSSTVQFLSPEGYQLLRPLLGINFAGNRMARV